MLLFFLNYPPWSIRCLGTVRRKKKRVTTRRFGGRPLSRSLIVSTFWSLLTIVPMGNKYTTPSTAVLRKRKKRKKRFILKFKAAFLCVCVKVWLFLFFSLTVAHRNLYGVNYAGRSYASIFVGLLPHIPPHPFFF